jgi:hypothetical protein
MNLQEGKFNPFEEITMRFMKWIVVLGALLLVAFPVFAQDTLAVGASVEGTLTASAPFIEYTFESAGDQRITITLVSDDFDCYLVLYNADGVEIAADDDSAGNLDSQIGPISLEAGTYTIRATSYRYRNSGATDSRGAFTLSIAEFETNLIEYGQRIEGELTADALTDSYTFRGEAGEAVVIRMVSSEFDSYLTLRDAAGSEIAYDDDSEGNFNARLGPFILPETGEYFIEARSYNRVSTGRYTLSLERVQIIALEYGDTAEARFDENIRTIYFTFDADSGDVVSISVSSGTIAAKLRLIDPSNQQIYSITDTDSQIADRYLNEAGTYFIVLEAESRGAGKLEITLARGELPSLDDGAQTLTFDFNVYEYNLRFTGQAGQTVTLNITSSGGAAASPYAEVNQGETFIASASGSSVDGLSFSFVTPEDGDVLVRISEYSGATLTVALER